MAEVVTPSSVLLPQQLGLCHSRAALHDSTNTSVRSGKRSIGHVQPYSSLHESNSRSCKFSASPPRFPVAYKAPPTVSISFSAACSQNRGFGFEATELELPDVRNVVPFPCSPSGGDEDVEMSDGTLCSRPSSSQPPARRKRRSACSSSSSSGPSRRVKSSKDPKDGTARKRPRKSKRHGADTWWLGIIHRSILQGLCEPEPDAASCLKNACDDNRHYQRTRHNTFEEQDRLLAERIRQKLLDSGCHSVAIAEGRTAAPLPSRLTSPPTLTPSVLMPSPILSLPAPVVECRTEPENMPVMFSSSNEVTVFQFPRPPCPAGKVLFYPKPSTPIAIPSLRNLHDDLPLTPPPSPEDGPALLGMKFRRSPSPPLLPPMPPRSRSTTPALHTVTTLTMPQLVASLTLAHRERSGLRSRGRSLKSTSKGSSKNMGKGAYSTGEPASQETGTCIEEDKEIFVITRSRGSQASRPCVDRRSPLCCVAYVENLQLSCPH